MTHRRSQAHGFTLIETMLAVLLLALLASGAAMSFSKPIQRSQERQAISEIKAADRAARLDAMRSNHAVRLQIDLTANAIRLFERQTLRSQTRLANAARIDLALIGQKLIRGQTATIDISGSGYSDSYAVHTRDTWVIVHGLTGETSMAPDEKTARSILDPQTK